MDVRLAIAVILAALGAPGVSAQGATDAPDLTAGRPILEFRPRYNHIEETSKPLTTEGWTYRAIVGWRTAPWNGWRFTLEAIHADNIGSKRFNDDGSQIGTSPYPLLPDPRVTDVNQAFVDYTGIEGLRVRAGRQVVRMDNQRFVSDNDFRQTPQLFDGVYAAYGAAEGVELTAAWFGNRRTTSGENDSVGLTLLHGAWNPAPGHALAAYAYFHDQAQNGAFTGFADNSYRIVGARAEGAWRVSGTPLPGADALDFVYVAEVARQDDYAGGDSRIDADYWRAGGGLATDRWTLRYDYEVRGSNRGLYGLQTPLTDFYAFNGWTLHFFNTPRTGLRDSWLTGRYAIGPFVFFGEEHRFQSDYANQDFGRETDLGITWNAFEGGVLRLQHARYRHGPVVPLHPDVSKTWLTFTYTY